jgi:divalent metal cation (Fe/Co/Zn/Cd) transporter
MAKPSGTKKVIYAAIIGNLLVAITKFVAFGLTGSSAMLSESVHSVVDTGNELLLLYGLRRSRVRADVEHPLGHGRELYFWSFVVAVLVFALGAGVSFYQGIVHLRQPAPLRDAAANYVVLFTAQLGPDNVVAALSAEFHDRLTTQDIEASVNRLEQAIRSKHPEITTLFVRPQTAEAWSQRRARLATEPQ